jgi:hypothetical protein
VKWISINKAQSEDLMQSLLSSPVHSFDEGLQSKLPEKHGVYAISVGSGEDTKFLWVGMTHKSKRGLRRRVWEDHYKNPTDTSDLPKVLLRVQPAWRLGDAKRWITETCRVRWIEVEQKAVRAFFEHYATALLRPSPTAGLL